jgi:hypothetical protein
MEATCTSRSEGIAMPLKKRKFFVAKCSNKIKGFLYRSKLMSMFTVSGEKIKEKVTASEST